MVPLKRLRQGQSPRGHPIVMADYESELVILCALPGFVGDTPFARVKRFIDFNVFVDDVVEVGDDVVEVVCYMARIFVIQLAKDSFKNTSLDGRSSEGAGKGLV